jgi:hypothetical protein
MTARVLLLLCSVGINAAIVGAFVVQPALTPTFIRQLLRGETESPASVAARKIQQAAERERRQKHQAAEVARENQAALWSALDSEDLPTLIARLRAAGFPPAVVRAIVSARVDRRFNERMKAHASTAEDTPYWMPTVTNSFNNPKYFEERQQIYRDRARMMRELLGDEAFAAAGVDPTHAQRQQFGELSKAKIDQVQRINDDYAEMISQVRAATQGIVLPEDRAKLALLEREKRADLAAILTPQELEDYEMRSSQITMRLRSALSLIDATEAEFRIIYRVQQPFAETLFPTDRGMFTQELRQRREEAQKQVADQLKVALGESRYAELARAQHYEFQQLARMTRGENIPLATAVRAFDLRASTSEESQRISNDHSMSTEQKLAALQTLAQTTRTQLLSALGPNIGPSYTKSAAWLQAIEKGSVVTFGLDGSSTTFRPIVPSPPPR